MAKPPADAKDEPVPRGSDDKAELAAHLARAGIVMEPENLASAAAEWAVLREHVALVNRLVTELDEPALVFNAGVTLGR